MLFDDLFESGQPKGIKKQDVDALNQLWQKRDTLPDEPYGRGTTGWKGPEPGSEEDTSVNYDGHGMPAEKEQGVAEGHADQQKKVFKKAGKPVGEVGVDRESSPGAGQWYMKHYASGTDLCGYDSQEEAIEELKHCLKQGVSESMKLSDIPPTMRRKLTMKDIEAERPQGAYRFRVGDKEFIDQKSAQEFAQGMGGRVEPISQQPQGNQPRYTHRVVDPQSGSARSFPDQVSAQKYATQTRGRVEPVREDQKKKSNPLIQDDLVEALKVRRDENENIILDEAGKDACYHKVRSRYKVWPSAYASGALVQCRKKGAANWGTGGKKK